MTNDPGMLTDEQILNGEGLPGANHADIDRAILDGADVNGAGAGRDIRDSHDMRDGHSGRDGRDLRDMRDGHSGRDVHDLQDARRDQDTRAEMPGWMRALAGDPVQSAEARRFLQDHEDLRQETIALRQETSTLRQAAQDVEALRQETLTLRANADAMREASASVERIDAAIFSGDARAQSEVVAEIARANPAAFRSLVAEAQRVLAGLEAGREHASREGNSSQRSADASMEFNADAASRVSAASQRNVIGSSRQGAASSQGASTEQTTAAAGNFDPAAYAAFERNTNDVVARDVRGSISDTLQRVLPEGVADGAARRIGEDIFNEVHRALVGDRALSEQVGAVLRERRFGNVEQQRVASLLASRAKQLVPSVARRVIGEWTSSVLGTARAKAARQTAASSRVDIAAAGGSLDSMPMRGMSAREVNYASISDDEILGLR